MDLSKSFKAGKKKDFSWETSEYKAALRRCEKLPTHEILNWADVAGSAMAQAFMDYRKHGQGESLAELRRAVSMLQAVTDQLIIRHENF